jgi:hypothetical protein
MVIDLDHAQSRWMSDHERGASGLNRRERWVLWLCARPRTLASTAVAHTTTTRLAHCVYRMLHIYGTQTVKRVPNRRSAQP